jgi:hypothetical protein
MNKKQKQMLINQAMQKVRPNSRGRKYINAVLLSGGNTWLHEVGKCRECYLLAQKGIDFLTEVIFENGQRADILALDVEGEGVYCIEILVSETEARFSKKEYPFPIVKKYMK